MKQILLVNKMVALVDDEDFESFSAKKWYSIKTDKHSIYAITKASSHSMAYMHRTIMNAQKGQIVDHIDGDGLNNQRSNLRFATTSQNAQNMRVHKTSVSGYKGVTWRKLDKLWYANIVINGKVLGLGNFKIKEDAAHAYNAAAIKHFGEFAHLNKIPSPSKNKE